MCGDMSLNFDKGALWVETVKTSGKEYFYSVSGLMVPKYMVSRDLTEKLDQFVDWVHKNTDPLEMAAVENVNDFIEKMETLYLLICDIHAQWLESEANKILRMAEMTDIEPFRKLLVPFFANTRTLALDIQMAQNQGFETGYCQRNEIETYKDIISSMRIIIALLNSGDYDKAFDVVSCVDEFRESDSAVSLFTNIAMKDGVQSVKIAERIIADYSKRIDSIIVSATESVAIKRLVVVDDMPDMLAALSIMLKDHFQVFAFPSGEQTLNFIDSKQQPDAFLLDIDMPDMDGFELAKRIRSRAAYENTPIIFLTGSSRKDALSQSLIYSPKAFIVKPANKDILISKLSSCLK